MTKFKNSTFVKFISFTLALIFILGAFSGCGKKEEPETTAPPTTAPVTAAPTTSPYLTGNINPLTGEANYSKEILNNRPVMVSVENHKDARPQWGIASADIVWEMVVEGGITRMLLMYSDASRLPDKIGPTRSARHYFVELAEGFDAIFVHFGGSPKAYSAIKQQGTDDIDGMYDGNTFSRDSSRSVSSEHRAYTTKDKVVAAIESKKFRTEIQEEYQNPFKFNSTAKALPGGKCTECVIPFSNYATYTYQYNAEEKLYYSSLNGAAFMDDNGTQQNFTNIIICYVTVTSLGDAKGRVTFDMSEGSGKYISNGTYQDITWKKGDYTDMLKLYDAGGNELALNAGRSYIALVPDSKEASTIIS